ncbi:MAG: ABC transporter permease [Desulfobacterales bacterium]|nr:ABC transporter permease [Pseudomonadota bacterium]MBU4355437.1 ABC transporter permease [Pseudomonadota bacterium]MCG2770632.1 ABC transporter permease [Desulfobacterales bacterium]
MWLYILKRLGLMVPMLLGITLISFTVIHLAPGTPTDMQTTLNPKASLEAQKRLRELYGLDKPLIVQYGDWLTRLVHLDFGRSFSPDRRPVWDKIKERIGITLGLNLMSLIIILGVSIPIGVIAAYRAHSWFDQATTLFVFFGFAMPTFWLALLLIMFFGVYLDWLPISGLTSLNYRQFTFWQKVQDLGAHVTLPVLVAAFGGLAGMSRYMRGNMLEVIRQDYITTARAKGLPERVVIFKHALRNALLPVITILGLSVPGLIGGSVIFESIFAIPGMGQLFYGAVMARDYPLVMGELVIGAVLTLVGNMLADLGYALVDPRIRAG